MEYGVYGDLILILPEAIFFLLKGDCTSALCCEARDLGLDHAACHGQLLADLCPILRSFGLRRL